MLLKVSHGKGRWVIFGSVAEVDYTDHHNAVVVKDGDDLVLTHTVDNDSKLEKVPDRYIVVDIYAEKMDGYFVTVKYIDGELMTIFFDTVAYLCNDDGRTIERIGGR